MQSHFIPTGQNRDIPLRASSYAANDANERNKTAAAGESPAAATGGNDNATGRAGGVAFVERDVSVTVR